MENLWQLPVEISSRSRGLLLSERGVRQQVSYFSRDELPLSITLLLDVSSSVRPILHQIRDGALTYPRQQKEILRKLFDSGTVVYGLIVCCTNSNLFSTLGQGAIRGVDDYVKQTGGEILGANKNEVDAKLALVIDRLRVRYAIGFKPADTTEDGRFRRVQITITSTKKQDDRPVVLSRRGYYFRRRGN